MLKAKLLKTLLNWKEDVILNTRKKFFLCLLVLMLLFTALPVSAAQSRRNPQATLQLTFDETQANCSVVITSDYISDQISATMELKQGSKTIDTWSSSSNGFLVLVGTAPAEKNKTYTLFVTYSINGVTRPTISNTQLNYWRSPFSPLLCGGNGANALFPLFAPATETILQNRKCTSWKRASYLGKISIEFVEIWRPS